MAGGVGLAADAVGRVNRIADDPARPLGEAVAELPWEAVVSRLTDWGPPLAAYRDHLSREVSLAELRAGTWLGVWRLWAARYDDAGRSAWEACLAGGRRELEARLAALSAGPDRA